MQRQLASDHCAGDERRCAHANTFRHPRVLNHLLLFNILKSMQFKNNYAMQLANEHLRALERIAFIA